MRKKTTRLMATMIALIIFPAFGFLIYQLITVDQNERMITSIYEEQLKTILFSVNQFSNDFMSGLMDKIEGNYNPSKQSINTSVEQLIAQDGFIAFAISKVDKRDNPSLQLSRLNDILDENALTRTITTNKAIINRLIDYGNQGYRKIEPTEMIQDRNGSTLQGIFCILSINDENYLFTGFIEPLQFIEEVLSPKMQQIAEEQMVLCFQKKDDPDILFSTDVLTNDLLVTSRFWLFPDLLLGISPRQVTIQDLIYEQKSNHILVIAIVSLLMISGVFLIIRNMQKEAQLNQAKADFISNVSHELRTPLALIQMFAETLLLKRANSEEKQHEYIEIIHKETNRLTNIVNRILNFSRIEANKRAYHKAPTNLNDLIKEVAKDYSYHLETNEFVLSLNLPEESIAINGDHEAIYEALIILIDNAMKYSDDKKQIQIGLEHSGQLAKLYVKDEGIGIATDRLPHIFDKFYRVADQDKYVAQGTGLGLSILKHIADAHEAKIDVSSSVGQGSTFTMTFKTI
jgi:two-component system phosphate regulon sensor histidine kinase PhoR